ncbi:MAG: proton-conducting transporter membrane subunit [Blastocatellia bacterium]|nr:proton-conducting transporter membrane subunit [Blastocatellia bacterium]
MNEGLLLSLLILLPGGVCALLGIGWLLGWRMAERPVARLTVACYCVVLTIIVTLWLRLLAGGHAQIYAGYGNWFEVGHYHFPLALWADRISLPLLALSAFLTAIVAVFSRRYIHRDEGFFRFFMLLNLFGSGILLFFAAGSFDLMIGGWEVVGVTSILLIAFFQHRSDPVHSALRVFATYRACDVGLLVGVVLMHLFVGTSEFKEILPNNIEAHTPLLGSSATMVAFLLLLAAVGKAAQAPFSGWLPRAMEGPTPSSAIFYGALSVHAGAYLLLRAQPIIAASSYVAEAILLIGLLTAVHATFVGRACADAKTSLAYASMAQLGIIFIEIGLGWRQLALWHIAGHALIRTLQFLRAPSMLHDHHRLHAAAGGHLSATGTHFEALLPQAMQRWLYRLALDRGHHDTFLDRFVVAPVVRLAERLQRFEYRWSEPVGGATSTHQQPLASQAELLSLKSSLKQKADGADA